MSNLLGTSGDDILVSTSANENIWGGTGGVDTAVFTGNLADYSVTDNGDGSYYILDLRTDSPDGRDKVRSIENFEFADQTVDLQTLLDSSRSEIHGTSANDTLIGTENDDFISGGAGFDSIWGGTAGEDTAIYSGTVSDYSIQANNNGSYTVTDLRGGSPDGTDTVRDIEMFEFSSGTVSLEAFLEMSEDGTETSLEGGGSDDVLLGDDGNNAFVGGAGNDTIWGGMGGENRLAYSGSKADYGIVLSDNGAYYVYDKRPGTPDGVDKVRNISVFEFADGIMTLEEFVAANAGHPGFQLAGTSGNDVLVGANTDDTLTTQEGLDRAWGGFEGDDAAVFSGNFDDYVVTENETGGAITLVDTREVNNDGVHVVRDVETFTFADQSVGLANIFTGAQTVAGVTTREIIGSAADDVFSAAHTDGLFDAYTNETLVGNAGSDKILGGPGDDIIYGDEMPTSLPEHTFTSTPDTDLPRFDFQSGLFQVIYGQVKKLNPSTGEYEIISEDYPNINATGMNPADGYAYGIGTEGEWKGHLLRIGSDGGIDDLGGGFQRSFTGAFHDNGDYYVRKNDTTLVKIDVEAGTQENVSFTGTAPPTVHDIVFIGDFAYGVSPSGILVTFDLENQTTSTASLDGVPVGEGAFGALWTAADGGLYVSHNNTGNIYGVSGHENGDPRAVLLTNGETAGVNDGFSYGSAPLPEELLAVGHDELLGGAGDDHLIGGAGEDKLDGGIGADILDGGEDRDWADYSRAEAAVDADLGSGGTGGEAAGDTYIDVENLKGSKFDDTLSGDDGVNHIDGNDGDDVITADGGDDRVSGGAGADTIDGGEGTDTLSYLGSDGAVQIDLATGTGTGADAEGDSFVNFEEIITSNYNDQVSGSAGVDRIVTSNGDDTISASAGSDHIWGGFGNDTVTYAGNFEDYELTLIADPGRTDNGLYQQNQYFELESTATGDVDVLRDIENIDFLNGTYDTSSNLFEGI